MISFSHDVHRDIVLKKLRFERVSVYTKNSYGLKERFQKAPLC